MSDVQIPSRKWGDEEEPVVPHPAPEVGARLADESAGEIPAKAKTWIKKATAAGWRVVPTYARGTSVDRHGKPAHLMHSLALRMVHPDGKHRAVLVFQAHAQAVAEDETVSYVHPADATWKTDSSWAWCSGVELPLPVGLVATKKEPDRETLGAYLINPTPRRKWQEMLAALGPTDPDSDA